MPSFWKAASVALSVHVPTLILVMWAESSASVSVASLCPPQCPSRGPEILYTVGSQHVLECGTAAGHSDLEQTDATVAAPATEFVHRHLVLQGAAVKDLFPII